MSRSPLAARRRASAALAWRLAAVGIALGVVLTAQIGRNGCLRHGADGFAGVVAAAETAVEASPIDHGSDAAHAACPLCTAAPIGASAAAPVAVTAPVVATSIAGVDAPETGGPHAAGPPIEYAPKTSPPVA